MTRHLATRRLLEKETSSLNYYEEDMSIEQDWDLGPNIETFDIPKTVMIYNQGPDHPEYDVALNEGLTYLRLNEMPTPEVQGFLNTTDPHVKRKYEEIRSTLGFSVVELNSRGAFLIDQLIDKGYSNEGVNRTAAISRLHHFMNTGVLVNIRVKRFWHKTSANQDYVLLAQIMRNWHYLILPMYKMTPRMKRLTSLVSEAKKFKHPEVQGIDTYKDMFTACIDSLFNVGNSVRLSVANMAGSMSSSLGWDNFIQPLIARVKEGVQRAKQSFMDMITAFVDVIKSFWESFLESIVSKLSPLLMSIGFVIVIGILIYMMGDKIRPLVEFVVYGVQLSIQNMTEGCRYLVQMACSGKEKEPEKPEAQGCVTTLAASLYSFLYRRDPPDMRNVSFILRTGESLDKLLDSLINGMEKIAIYFYERWYGKPYNEERARAQALDKLSDRVSQLETTPNLEDRICTDRDLATQIAQLYKDVMDFGRLCQMGRSLRQVPHSIYKEVHAKMSKYYFQTLVGNPKYHDRQRPRLVGMFGVPGKGKTTVIDAIVDSHAQHEMSRGRYPKQPITSSLRYTWNENSPYRDGYNPNHFAVILNEVFSMIDPKDRQAVASDILCMAETSSMNLNCASLEKKEVLFMASPLIVFTTNVDDFHNMGMTDHKALLRRINFPIEVFRNQDIDFSKVREQPSLLRKAWRFKILTNEVNRSSNKYLFSPCPSLLNKPKRSRPVGLKNGFSSAKFQITNTDHFIDLFDLLEALNEHTDAQYSTPTFGASVRNLPWAGLLGKSSSSSSSDCSEEDKGKGPDISPANPFMNNPFLPRSNNVSPFSLKINDVDADKIDLDMFDVTCGGGKVDEELSSRRKVLLDMQYLWYMRCGKVYKASRLRDDISESLLSESENAFWQTYYEMGLTDRQAHRLYWRNSYPLSVPESKYIGSAVSDLLSSAMSLVIGAGVAVLVFKGVMSMLYRFVEVQSGSLKVRMPDGRMVPRGAVKVQGNFKKIPNKIKMNLNHVVVKARNGQTMNNQMLFIDSNRALMPYHVFTFGGGFEELALCSHENQVAGLVWHGLTDVSFTKLEGRDLALVVIKNTRPRKNLHKQFGAKCTQVENSVTRIFLNNQDCYMSEGTNAIPQSSYDFTDIEGNSKTEREAIVCIGMPGKKGICGSPLFSTDPRFGDRIIGIHVAGSDNSSYFAPVCLEDLVPQAQGASQDMSYFKRFVSPISMAEERYDMPQTCLGVVEPLMRTAVKTRLVQTEFSSSDFSKEPIYPISKAPAHLISGPEPGQDIWKNGMKRPKVITPKCDPKLDSMIKKDPSMFWQGFCYTDRPSYTCKKLDESECIKGIDGHVESVDMSTSAGFPFNAKRISKDELIDKENGKLSKIARPVWEYYDECVRSNKVFVSIFGRCIKDELLKLAKVQNWTSRIFMITNVIECLWRKQFTGDLYAHWARYSKNQTCQIGCNPYTYDWECARKRAFKFPNVIGGDFSSFDWCSNKRFAKLYFKFLNSWIKFEKGSHDYRCLKMYCMTLISPFTVQGNRVYVCEAGHASGGYDTTNFNSFINYVLHATIFYYLRPEGCDFKFENHVSLIDLGDDVIGSVSNAVASWYNMVTISKAFAEVWGYIYTTPAKSTVEKMFLDKEEQVFLQRRFVVRDGKCYAPLEPESIWMRLLYVRTRNDPDYSYESQLEDNIFSAAGEMFMHGETAFRAFKLKVQNYIRKNHMSVRWTGKTFLFWQDRYEKHYYGNDSIASFDFLSMEYV